MSKYGGNNRIDFGVHFNTDKSSLEQVKRSLQEIQNVKPVNFSGTERQLREIQQQAKKVQIALQKAFNVKLNNFNVEKFHSSLNELGTDLNKIYAEANKLGSVGTNAFNKIATSLTTTNTRLRESQGLLHAMGETMMNTIKWGIASRVMNSFTQSVSQAFQYVKSLDSALTDIRIVTGDSREEMAKFAEQANKAAQTLGRSTMDYTKAALTYYQQGLSDEDVAVRTETTLKAQNITGAGQEMADYLTAVWNGYKVANEEAELYVDKLAAVADSSASNMAQLATAMSKVASSANLLGVPVDSLNAQIATIIATTREAPESVGNSLKTIYARINDITTGADDAEVSLGNYSQQMAKVGISVLDTNGRLRDTQDVIEEVGNKWSTLSKEQQVYLARTMAGQRQYSRLLALFDNWGKYTDLVNVSMDAQGSLMQKNSRYMDSLAAHMEQLGAAGERVKSAMIDSDSFKGLIDIGTNLTLLLANFIEGIGGGGSALLALAGTATHVFSGVISKEIGNVIIQARTNKQIYQEMKMAIQQTENFKSIVGQQINPTALQQYLGNLDKIHQSWSVLSQDERQSQEQRAKDILSESQRANQLEKSIQKAEELQKVLTHGKTNQLSTDKGLETYKNQIEEVRQAYLKLFQQIQAANGNITTDMLVPFVNTLKNLTPASEEASNSIKQICENLYQLRQEGSESSIELNDIYNAIERVIATSEQTANGILNLNKDKLELADLKNRIQQLYAEFNGINQNSLVLFRAEQITKAIGGIARISSGIIALSNAFKILKNDSLSSGEKIFQFLSSGGMAIGMLVSGFKSLNATLGITKTLAITFAGSSATATGALVAEALTTEQLKKLKQQLNVTRTKEIGALGKQAILTAAVDAGLKEQTVTTLKATLAQEGFNAAIEANPIGAIVMGLTVLVSALMGITALWDKFTMSAEEAVEAVNNYKEKLKELNESSKEYANKRNTLEEAKYEYEALADKAGANTGDSYLDRLTQNQRARYNQLKNIIAEYNQDALAGYNARGQAILTNNNALKETIELLEKQHQLQIDTFYNSEDYKEYLEAKKTQYKEAKQEKVSKENFHLDDGQINKAENAKAKAVGVLSKYKNEGLTQADKNYFVYKEQMDQLNAIFNDGVENLYDHYNELIELQNLIANEAPHISQDFNKYLDQIIEVAKVPQENEAEWQAANLKLDQISEFSSGDILIALQATKNNTEYSQLAKQIGEQNINSIIKNYISGLTRTEDFNEPEAVEEIKSKLLRPLSTLNLTETDFSEISEQISDALSSQDFSQMTVDRYEREMKKTISTVYETNENLQKMAKNEKTKQAFKSLIKSQFGLEDFDFKFDEEGKFVPSIVNNITKSLSEAQDKVKVALKDNKIKLSYEDTVDLMNWVGQQNGDTLSNLDSILGKVNWDTKALAEEGKTLADEFQRAKNEVNEMATSEALTGASQLLQKQASGESLDKEEQEQLSGYLSQLQKLIPQYRSTIQVLRREWLQGTKFYQRSIEEVVNATFEMIEKQKEARMLMQEAAGVEVDSGPTEAESSKALSLIQNTENLQNAQNKNLLLTKDYQQALGTLASKYDTCTEELSRWVQAIASGNEQTIASAEHTLLLSTRAAELAEKSGLSADQIERTAAWLAESDSKLQENAELAADAAERYLRLNNALDEIYESGDKYKELLNELNTSGKDAIYANEELFKSFSEFKEQIADLFDGDVEFISDKWVTDNMQKIIDAVNSGSEQALDELNQSLASDMLLNLKVKINEEEWGMSKDQFLHDLYELEDGTDLINVEANLDLLLWTQQLVTAMQEAGYAQGQIEAALNEMGITVDLAPYEEGLNEAIDKSALAGKLASNAFAENAGSNATVISQAKTQESEDLLGGTDYQVGQVRGWYTYPVINYGEGLFGPEVESVGQRSQEVLYPSYTPIPKNDTVKKSTSTVAQALQVVGATKSSGGKIANYNKPAQRSARKARSGSGGGGKKGGGGNKSFTPAKPKTTKIESKQKTQQNDPYYKINKSIDKQSSLLKKLQDQEKNLSGKDRLENLEAQAEALKEQNELLEERQRISDNIAAENSTANLRKRLKDSFGSNIAFDSDGKFIDKNTIQRAAVDAYNNAERIANATYKKQQDAYNKWLTTVYNLDQEKYKSEKETRDEKLKNAEEERKEAIQLAEDEYKKKTDLIKAYEKALQDDIKNYEQYMENVRSVMQKIFESRKLRVQFTLDSGELNREYQDFENKVIRRIKDSDIVGNAAAQFRELSFYIQSQELQSVSDEIKAISDDIARVNAGAWTQLMGVSQTNYEMLKPEDQQLVRKEALGKLEQRLKELVKQEQDALSAIQDLTDEIAESYLDSIDAAKDALDEHINQYERINDLIEHNVKLTELLYGDKGYDTLNKYYDLQKQNNMNTLQTLKQQEEYWRSRMQNEVVGSDAWKKFKENLDDAVDAVNSKLEDMLDNLTTQFEKKLAAAVERVNNKLTGGLGTSYLDEQWDYLNNYDDYFLDTYNATTGIEDVTRAYQQALDDAAANPKQQQRLNKLMNDQLKILREKDHLTEYDLERAKSMLEVEKARMALEDARNNKTKMRLRRDSQGNYTYQYVADEEKLGDLQQALADAQNDLYNQDKEHYKENLNTLYDTYKEYLEKMQELTEEYRQAQAEAEATGNDTWLKQVQARIDLAKEQYDKFYTGLLEDNEYNQTYVAQAFANGLNLDLSGLSSEEVWGVIQENVPWAASNIQNLANSISNLGGLLPATNSLLQDFSSAAAQYKADMNDILEAGGTSIQTIGQVINEEGGPLDTNIIEANSQVIMGYLDEITQKALTDVNTMQDLTQKLDEYWQNLNNNIQTYINNTREGYNTLQELLDSSTRAEVLDYIVPQTNTTSTEGLAQAKEQLSLENISGEDIKALYDSYLSYLQNTNGALEVPRSQVQYQQLAENQQQLQEQYDRFYTDLVQDMIQQVSSMSIDSQIDQMTAGTSQLLSNLIKNQSLLDQNVHIDANFPNVNNHTQIEEAFNNLVNMAAMRASGYRD